MKQYFISAIAALALSCTFVACGNDNDDPVINYTSTADQESAGTYSGTFYRTGDDGTTEYSGTVTLAPAGKENVTNVTFSCPDASINATSIANVWHSNYGFQFFNQTTSDANKLGTSFAGRIDGEGNIDISFTISQKVGRKNYDFKYEFIGKK